MNQMTAEDWECVVRRAQDILSYAKEWRGVRAPDNDLDDTRFGFEYDSVPGHIRLAAWAIIGATEGIRENESGRPEPLDEPLLSLFHTIEQTLETVADEDDLKDNESPD